uniref:Uncharacterized protein n=1 Tax=Arundo donax TaxID=35708 RepID=A0A0A9GZS5_ARUDO
MSSFRVIRIKRDFTDISGLKPEAAMTHVRFPTSGGTKILT